MAEPHFAMLWHEDIPVFKHTDAENKRTSVDVIGGHIEEVRASDPAPDSWAADPTNEVAIWTIKMDPKARWKLPKASPGINRTLYFYKGNILQLEGQNIPLYHAVKLHADKEVTLQNGADESKLLLLQGKPIDEPVVQHGPFVMNTAQEIQNTMNVFAATQFGGWPWPASDHVHPREKGRFAKFADGTVEEK